MLGSLILYLKGMRIMMFQLSGFYCKLGVKIRGTRGDVDHLNKVPSKRARSRVKKGPL